MSGFGFEVRIEGVEKLVRELESIGHGLGEKAMQMAINRTAAKARTSMKQAITAEYNLPSAVVLKSLLLKRAGRGHLRAVLRPFDSPSRPGKRSMNVIHFLEKVVTLAERRRRKKSGTQKQLRFKIRKGGGLITIPGSFVGNKGRTIFERIGNSRLPIKPVQTIGVPQMFNTRRIKKKVLARIRRELPVEINSAVRTVLRKLR